MRSSAVSFCSLFGNDGSFCSCVDETSAVPSCSPGAAVGDAGEDGEAAPRRPRREDGEVTMPGRRKPRPLSALVQEWERVQEGPENRRVQGAIFTTKPLN